MSFKKEGILTNIPIKQPSVCTTATKLSSGYHSMTDFASFSQTMFDTPPLLSPPPDTPSSQLQHQSSLLSNCSLISHTNNSSNNSNSNNNNSSISAKIVPQSPTGFHFSRNISVVDLNNKETTSILYLMMQQQKQQQMQQQQQFKLVNSPSLTNSQVFTMSPYSSSPSSTTSLPLSPMKSPQSPLSMSPTSNSNMLSMNPTQLVRQTSTATTTAQLNPFTSSQPQHQQLNNIVGNKRIANQFFKIINLNKTNSCSLSSTTNNISSITSMPLSSSSSSSSSPIPAPKITTINDNILPVMSQENLSQQHQQQQQQLTNSTIINNNNNNNNNENFSNNKQYIPLNSNVTVPVSAHDTNGNVVLKSAGNEETLLNNNSNTNVNDNCNQLNGANVTPIVNDSTLPIQQSVTVNSQLGHVELKKLQQQAAANQLCSPSGHNITNSIASTTSITTNATTTTANKNSNYNQNTSGGEETEEENDVLEDSPDGRWIKRNESVSQRDVPGIDQAYLAMDTEYGIEVVWNEIILSDGKKMKNKQDQSQIDLVFENLINLNHPNIVKFHKHWRDPNKPRIVFITEYMSSGSLKQFLRKAKRTNQKIKMQTWKRWCIQLLTALHYLHNCDPPIIHGDLSCDTIFIQHNGLIKIGSIAPDIVNQHVKTCIDKVWWSKNAHFMAPELKEIYNSSDSTSASNLSVNGTSANQLTTSNLLQIPQHQTGSNSSVSTTAAVDIYAFGMVALEMFHLDLGGNGDTHAVTPELIKSSIECLDVKQRDFITRCLQPDPKKRPTAKQLLFDPLLFEVPTLRLLAAHQYIKHQNESRDIESFDFRRENDCVIATTNRYFEQQAANNNTETSTSNNTSSTSSSISSSTNSSSNSLSSNTPSPTNTPATLPSLSNASSKYIVDFKYSSLPPFEANKYLEDVKNGIYPLTAYGLNQYNQQQQQQHQLNKQKHHQQQQILADQMHIVPTLDNQTMLTVNNEINFLTNTPSFSPTNTSISGTSTSIANMSSNQLSSNQSSNSSSSSTSPSQSLTQQQQQHLIHNEPIHAGDFLMDNQDLESEMVNSLQHVTNAFTHASASVQQQQQQFFVNNMDTPQILNSSPSASPPPFQPSTLVKQLPDNEQLMQPQQQQQFNFSDQLSRTQSPITTTTTNILNNSANLVQINGAFPPVSSQSSPPNNNKQQPHNIQSSSNINEKLGETNLNADTTTITTTTAIPVEKRHAIKIQFNLKCIEKLHNYQLSLNIVFDDNTTRFLESQININKDNPYTLSQDLIDCGLVSEIDKKKLCEALTEAINTRNDETPNSYFLSK